MGTRDFWGIFIALGYDCPALLLHSSAVVEPQNFKLKLTPGSEGAAEGSRNVPLTYDGLDGGAMGPGGGRGYSFRRGRRPLSASEIAEQPEEGDIAFCPWDSKGKQAQGPDQICHLLSQDNVGDFSILAFQLQGTRLLCEGVCIPAVFCSKY